MKPSEKLIERLKSELGLDIPDVTVIKTLHTGRHQKASGAWSWMLYHTEPGHTWITNYGSTYSVTSLLKSKRLTILRSTHSFLFEILPDDNK